MLDRYVLVWTEATALYQEMVQGEGLNLEEDKTISDVHDLTAKVVPQFVW